MIECYRKDKNLSLARPATRLPLYLSRGSGTDGEIRSQMPVLELQDDGSSSQSLGLQPVAESPYMQQNHHMHRGCPWKVTDVNSVILA